MDRNTHTCGGVRGGALVDLGSLSDPTGLPRELKETAGMTADVEQRARRRSRAFAQRLENALEDQILLRRIELLRDPLRRPALVVSPVEVTRQRWNLLGLSEPAGHAAPQPDTFPGIGGQLECAAFPARRRNRAQPRGTGCRPWRHIPSRVRLSDIQEALRLEKTALQEPELGEDGGDGVNGFDTKKRSARRRTKACSHSTALRVAPRSARVV